MGKNQSASNLTNVIQVSSTGNVLFVSGSTTLMSISSSGAITTTGVISGSNALSASYAANADTLDGLDSTVFTLTSSFNAQTASFTAFTASILATTSSLNSFSASVLTFTGSAATRLGALESYTSSLNNKTSSFATTGSNIFIGTQTISGSVLQSGSFTSTGTLTAQTLVVQTITSSVVYSSGSNIFGNSIGNSQVFTGSVLITGSLTIAAGGNASAPTIYGSTIACSPIGCFATSCATSFIGGTICSTMGNHSCLGIGTQTPSCVLDVVGTGRITVSGGNNLILSKTSGPSINFQKTAATAQTWSLTTDPNFRISDDTAVTVPFQITLGTGAATFACNVQSATLSVGGTATADQLSVINGTSNSFATMRLVGSNRGGQINFYNQSYPTAQISVDQSGNIDFSTGVYAGSSVSSKISLTNTGQVCFACTVCAPQIISTGCINVGATSTSLGSLISIQSANDQAGITMYNSYDCNKWSLRTGTVGVSNKGFAIMDDICNATRIQINGAGYVGIGTCTPATQLEIKGTNTYHKVATCFFSTYNAGFAFSDYLAGITYEAGGNTLCLYSNYATYGGIVLSTATVPRLVVSNNGATRTIMNGISTAVLQQSYNTGLGGCINVCFDIYNAIPGKGNGYIFQADIYVSGYGSAGSSGLVYRASVGGYDGHYVGVGGYHQYSEQVKCAMGVAIALYNPSGSPCLLGVTIYNCNGSYTHTGTMRMVITY